MLPIIYVGVVAVTLEGPFQLLCLGQVFQLNCSHPLNEGTLAVVWERNGSRILVEDLHTLDTQTYEIVDIYLTSVTFKDKVWIYKCYTQNLDTSVREYSNEVVVDTVGECLDKFYTMYVHFSQLL